jgi:hypothetical protein
VRDRRRRPRTTTRTRAGSARCRAVRVADRVGWSAPCRRREMPRWYRSADVLAATPWYEPFGLTRSRRWPAACRWSPPRSAAHRHRRDRRDRRPGAARDPVRSAPRCAGCSPTTCAGLVRGRRPDRAGQSYSWRRSPASWPPSTHQWLAGRTQRRRHHPGGGGLIADTDLSLLDQTSSGLADALALPGGGPACWPAVGERLAWHLGRGGRLLVAATAAAPPKASSWPRSVGKLRTDRAPLSRSCSPRTRGG